MSAPSCDAREHCNVDRSEFRARLLAIGAEIDEIARDAKSTLDEMFVVHSKRMSALHAENASYLERLRIQTGALWEHVKLKNREFEAEKALSKSIHASRVSQDYARMRFFARQDNEQVERMLAEGDEEDGEDDLEAGDTTAVGEYLKY